LSGVAKAGPPAIAALIPHRHPLFWLRVSPAAGEALDLPAARAHLANSIDTYCAAHDLGAPTMASRDTGFGLLAEAIEMLRDADRLHRQFFRLAPARSGPCWEPPIDVVETDRAVVVRVALPGVPAQAVEVTTDGAQLRVVGQRPMPVTRSDAIHRLEIPYGHFERRVELPRGRYDVGAREMVDGCLVLTLRRLD
jgi:HSP20 family protein